MPLPSSENETQASDTTENAVTRGKPEPADMTTTSETETYTVKRGDTLSTISEHFYGNAKDYERIVDANREQIRNHNQISVDKNSNTFFFFTAVYLVRLVLLFLSTLI